VLLGSSCAIDTNSTGQSTQRPDIVSAPAQTVELGGEWQELENGFSYMQYFFEETSSAQLHLYRIDADTAVMRMEHNEEQPISIYGWSARFPDAAVLLNGVYFSEDNFPSGFVSVGGEQLGERQFSIENAGMITFDDEVSVLDGAVDVVDLNMAQNLAQNHPVLISHGTGTILSDDGASARRTFIGRDTVGQLYVGVLPRKGQTLYETMTLLQSLDIAWDTVINLDGGSSTGLAANIGDHSQLHPSYALVPNIFILEPK
jgi:hypothetical protein